MKLPFQWDDANTQHVIEDYPERENTVEEVESVFDDPNLVIVPDRISKRGEQEYSGVGYSNKNVIRFLAFTLRNNEIRVFSCRIANKKERAKYYEINREKITNSKDREDN